MYRYDQNNLLSSIKDSPLLELNEIFENSVADVSSRLRELAELKEMVVNAERALNDTKEFLSVVSVELANKIAEEKLGVVVGGTYFIDPYGNGKFVEAIAKEWTYSKIKEKVELRLVRADELKNKLLHYYTVPFSIRDEKFDQPLLKQEPGVTNQSNASFHHGKLSHSVECTLDFSV